MSQIPLLFLGDSPSLQTGLARIGRDLALLASRLPQFRVAYLGRSNGAHIGGGIADSRLPFMQYTYQPTAEDQWGTRVLPDVWANWSRGERGAIMTLWDLSRLTWFGDPRPMGGEYEQLFRFVLNESGAYAKWGYFAIDAEGPGANGALAPILAETAAGYDRVLAYSQFGKRVLDASLRSWDLLSSNPRVEWLPHGYNGRTFQPRDRAAARAGFGIAADSNTKLVGCVMSNQVRKDFGLWARTMAIVRKQVPSLHLWVHTDSLTRHWDLRILLDTFGLGDITLITMDQPTDEEMSWRYSACDLTVLPSLGEGFGYPIVESQACGVPVVHGDYAAGCEWIYDMTLIARSFALRSMDTRYCMMRPIYDPDEWACAIVADLQNRLPGSCPQQLCTDAVAHLEWKRLGARWERWFLAGAEQISGGEAA